MGGQSSDGSFLLGGQVPVPDRFVELVKAELRKAN